MTNIDRIRRVLTLVATLPIAGLAAQQEDQTLSTEAPWPCEDTSLTRWLPPDSAPGRSEVEARELLEHYLARTYAPILRFAPSERYFPTMPFYTAFLDSARAVVPISRTEGIPAVSSVRAAYDSALDLSARPHELKLPLPVVFYRVCDLIAAPPAELGPAPTDSQALAAAGKAEDRRWREKARHVWDYLRSDEQAWHRFGLETALTSDTTLTTPVAPTSGQRGGQKIKGIRRFRVIQYFVYYMQDWGLLGHPQDIEYAFVFVPTDTNAIKSFRVIVGAGHDPPAPNNVLVMVSREASKQRHYHPNILVELGGHSSAPDMPPFGQFSAGLDVNWHIDDLWGTRDEQATAGLSFSGRYEGTMTYPRDPEDAVTLFPRGLGAGADSSRQVLADLVRVSPDYLAERAHQASQRDSVPSAERRELAEKIWHEYRTILQASEGVTREAIGKSDSSVAIEKEYTQAAPTYQVEIGKALERDSVTRAQELESIAEDRHSRVVEGIRRLLRQGGCRDTIQAQASPACLDWLGDGLDPTAGRVVELLEEGSRRIPADSLLARLLLILPESDPNRSPLDAITNEIKQVVTERLRPEYSLIPIRYLQALYGGAIDSNRAQVVRHLKLITRLLHPATCDELACGLSRLRGKAFDTAFYEVVCGPENGQDSVPGSVIWRHSLACRLDSAAIDSMRFWDQDVYDDRRDAFGKPRRWPARKHKIWEHEQYRHPETIFRTELFRPTALQVKNSRRSFWSLFHAGYNLDFGRASNPYIGMIIPAFRSVDLPFKVPGYLAFQAGPYLGQPYRGSKATLAMSVLYDRQFRYFYGLFMKAHWANRRSDVEGGSGASDFTWTFGASVWLSFLPRLHFRPGFRFDTSDLRPLLDRGAFELQIEYRK